MVYLANFSTFKPRGRAVSTFNRIKSAGMLSAFEEFLESYFDNSIPSEDDINNLLWFKGDAVLEALGIDE